MENDRLPEKRSSESTVGRFLRRLSWRREIGPVRAEADVSVRELVPEQQEEPKREPPAGDG